MSKIKSANMKNPKLDKGIKQLKKVGMTPGEKTAVLGRVLARPQNPVPSQLTTTIITISISTSTTDADPFQKAVQSNKVHMPDREYNHVYSGSRPIYSRR